MDTAIYSFAAVVTVLVAVQVTDRQPPRSWNNGFQSTRLQLWVWMTMCTFNQNSLPPPPLYYFFVYIYFFSLLTVTVCISFPLYPHRTVYVALAFVLNLPLSNLAPNVHF